MNKTHGCGCAIREMCILDYTNKKIYRIMLYTLTNPEAKKYKEDSEHRQWIEKTPQKTQKSALILEFELGNNDFF